MDAPTYTISPNVSKKFNGYGLHNTSPSWMIAFYPYDINTIGLNNSIDLKSTSPIIVLNDAISVGVTNSKRSNKKAASISLKLGEMDYSKAINNGDHVLIWMANYQEDINKTYQNVVKGSAANGFDSGLKFTGKVSSINKTASVDATGTPSFYVDIVAESFSELDLSVYVTKYAANVIDPIGSENSNNIGTNGKEAVAFFSRLNPTLWESFNNLNKRQWKTPDEIVLFLLQIFLGSGPSEAITTDTVNTNSTTNIRDAYNNTLLYPTGVSRIFKAISDTNLDNTYLDIVRMYTGVQSYSGGSANDNMDLMVPDNAPTIGTIRKGPNLKGAAYLYSPTWENVPLSQVVREWINPISNELYTSLRWTGSLDGIRPTISHRQIPLSTQLINKYKEQVKNGLIDKDATIEDLPPGYTSSITEFKNLPRWKISESLVNSINIGASNSARINFVQVFPSGILIDLLSSQSQDGSARSFSVEARNLALSRHNFVADDIDIQKHGLCAAIMEANMDIPSTTSEGDHRFLSFFWAAMQADFQMNSHLKFTGKISTVGIQEPISEGDNLEFGGILYHIEGVEHKARISGTGTKEFISTFTLSNGIVADSLTVDNQLPIYPGQVGGYVARFGQTVSSNVLNKNNAADHNQLSFPDDNDGKGV